MRQVQSLRIEVQRRKDHQKGPEDRFQVLFGIDVGHGDGGLQKNNIQEFLHNLVADNSPSRLDGCADQIRGTYGLLRSALIKRISEYIRVPATLNEIRGYSECG